MEQVPRFELSVSKFGAPEYDDILNSDLPQEEKVKQIKMRGQQYEDEINRGAMLDNIRMGLGTAMSAASFHPILNIPYVGTGIGGAMYDAGQAIVEGDKLGDIAKRAGRGFVIGETVGAVPYVGKVASKTKAGQAVLNSAPVQAVGDALNKAGEKFAQSKAYDALMTDIKAFNPNKQTMYHGSPYDFNKFSNEAIGTGEGAQAHGYGHYAAKNKDVAERYAETISGEKPIGVRYKGENYEVGFNPKIADWEIKGNVESLTPEERHLFELVDSNRSLEDIKEKEQKNIDRLIRMKGRRNRFRDAQKSKDIINLIDNNDVEILPENKQLYKLSVPKDDVMLREDLPFSEQPKAVQDALKKLANDYKEIGYGDLLDSIGYDEKGDSFYRLYSRLAGNGGNAARELSDRGIKGISYNGGIDGEARVIFNPDDIDIVRKYYNQPNLYEQLTEKQNTGALVDALLNR